VLALLDSVASAEALEHPVFAQGVESNNRLTFIFSGFLTTLLTDYYTARVQASRDDPPAIDLPPHPALPGKPDGYKNRNRPGAFPLFVMTKL